MKIVSGDLLEAMEKLPQGELPIHVGSTGYIHLNEQLTTFPNSWCYDELNRVVFIFNNVLYFQRYETRGPVMHNPLSANCFNEILRSEEREKVMSFLASM